MDFKYFLKLCLIFVIPYSNIHAAATTTHAIVCDQAYALCTSAACIPHPNDNQKSICDCVVQKGKSAGFATCKKRKPRTDKYQVTHLISTFSFEQFSTKKSLNCPKGMPWSDCVDMPCTVDPQNTNRAICLCKLNKTQAFFTFGGNCERSTCILGFWSGATPGAASKALRDVLSKEVRNPATPTSCAINTES